MPPKKSNTSYSTRAAQRDRAALARESSADREDRLARMDARMATHRASQSEEAREAARAANAARTQRARASQSSQARDAREEADAARLRATRASRRSARIAADRAAAARQQRGAVSEDEAAAGPSNRRRPLIAPREAESDAEADARRDYLRVQVIDARAQPIPDARRISRRVRDARAAQIEAQLMADARRNANLRVLVTDADQAEAERIAQARRRAAVRASHADLEMAARMNAISVLVQDARDEIAIQQAAAERAAAQRVAARRVRDAQRQRDARAALTPSQAEARRARDTQRRRDARAAQSPDRAAQLREIDRVRRAEARARNRQPAFNLAAFAYDPDLDYPAMVDQYVGRMNKKCDYCGALKYAHEAPGLCCANGKVVLPALNPPIGVLRDLMSDEDFLLKIKKYNSCFQFTSFGSTGVLPPPVPGQPMISFRVQGQVYHQHGALLPPHPTVRPSFMQIYFVGDTGERFLLRADRNTNVLPQVVEQLEIFFERYNELLKLFRRAIGSMTDDDHAIRIRPDRAPADGRYNEPVAEEVAIIRVGEPHASRDIIIRLRGGGLKYISELHRSYDALQYPIMFWQGEDGYNLEIFQRDPETGLAVDKKVSPMRFYAHRLMIREGQHNHLLQCQDLLSQFGVDMGVKVEGQRLRYITANQSSLRTDSYIHLRDTVLNDLHTREVGRPLVILPSSYIGSPRHMHEYAQDAMTYVREYGRPDLFVTFTCNPLWPEITAQLQPGQEYKHRHDIIVRVYKQKLQYFIESIKSEYAFGATRAWMYSIEFQKRGLPHAHLLFWRVNKLQADQIDDVVSAEVPNPRTDYALFELVTKYMVHGPCGRDYPKYPQPCIVDGKCSKGYPRAFREETIQSRDGYPLYRRRQPGENGHTFSRRVDRELFLLDNQWIVPYNKVLLKMFHTHINVEICSSIKSIKYVCKYVTKGADMAVFQVDRHDPNRRAPPEPYDEVAQYQLGRYISSSEAMWRLFSFPTHERWPPVYRLQVHLKNGERVVFSPEEAAARAQEAPPRTTLTAFFALCQEDEFAKTLLYKQVPEYYTYVAKRRVWQRRRQGRRVPDHPGIFQETVVGRVYTVPLSMRECFYLRMLLLHVEGPTSYESLRTVNNHVFATYEEACRALLLLESDTHWETALREAVTSVAAPGQIRAMFAIILTYCAPSNPRALWEQFRNAMSEDILRRERNASGQPDLDYDDDIYNEALVLLERACVAANNQKLHLLGMPQPDMTRPRVVRMAPPDVGQFDSDLLRVTVRDQLPTLNPEQFEVFRCITEAAFARRGGFFFLDAPGGTGKTYVLSMILAKIRSVPGYTALACASSGIAATLLDGGRTAHAAMKLPMRPEVIEEVQSSVCRGTPEGDLLSNYDLIIWDECTMVHKRLLETLDVTLRDLRDNRQTLFGGALVLMSGDFRQILPVVPRGTAAQQVDACLNRSVLWPQVQTLRLTTNMRVQLTRDPTVARFAQQLLSIGEGTMPMLNRHTGLLRLPRGLCTLVATKDELLERVYADIAHNYTDHAWLRGRAILAPKNVGVNQLNKTILDLLPGDERTYKSFDTLLDDAQTIHWTTELLNSIEASGLPSHVLKLKKGAPIILLRNLQPPKLVNGTRLVIERMQHNVLHAVILAGKFQGHHVLIPRIPIIPTDFPFDFKRVQFPVRLAFAMSINKAQGQTLQMCGLDLETPCFSHGQLYVACSRVGRPDSLFVNAPRGQTTNVVHASVFMAPPPPPPPRLG